MSLTLQFHCKGVVHEVDLDLDVWSYFEARDLVKELGVVGNFKLWWNLDGNSDVGGWKPLTEDKEANDLATAAEENVGEAHIFVEIVDGIQSGGTGYGATTTMGYSSDDSVRGVHFDDNEEERTVGLDDGFDVGEVVQRRIRLKSIAKKRSSVKKFRKKLPIRRNDNLTGEGSRGHEGGQDDGDVADGGRREDEPVQIKVGSGEGSRDDDGLVQNYNVIGESGRDDDGPVQNDNLTGEGSGDDDGPVQNDNLIGEGNMHGEPVFGEGNRDNGPQPIHELEENYVSEELNRDDPDLDSDEAERRRRVATQTADATGTQSQPIPATGSQSQPLAAGGAQSQPLRPVRRKRVATQTVVATGSQSQPLTVVGAQSQAVAVPNYDMLNLQRRRVATQSAVVIPTT
ncbi:X-linked retinitis pigmentosa GTPase regulator-interacting protein [Sesbania bispinosa]|nr:X-linked retinitis pigmentosa GTPase regulator-interacting protein [Sesbania bispinosa]